MARNDSQLLVRSAALRALLIRQYSVTVNKREERSKSVLLSADGKLLVSLLPVVSSSLRINFLNVNDVHIEEESWLDMKQRILNIKSRCLTWAQYSTFHEVSVFKQSVENPNWTEFHQKGSIVVTGAGKLNRLCEVFAQAFFNKGVKKVSS
ncbi:PRELI domain-containing protein 2 [Acipenser ruthenus]|uniref:PRELI domain-containing protein 2 n=1 Tax=Acipenser ruthenus TaxID=7906 RepID=A0A662YQA3_ACIRT|nr:PRELI domain-containing protein 2 [Acipenser ruthenus]